MRGLLKYLPIIISAFLYFGIFVFSFNPPSDSDLGWHLKYGESFFEQGHILRDNTFSNLMPSYHWNNSSWATDLMSYQTFHLFGFSGLSALGSLVITLTFFFMGKAAKLGIFEKVLLFPVILYFTNPVNSVSFRGQILSLLFMVIMFYILSILQKNKKIIFFLIPLFILWSNFHGEFILGLALLGIWTFVYLLKEFVIIHKYKFKQIIKEEKYLLTSFFGSIFASLINPFGFGVYFESLGHFSDPLQKFVVEFLPVGQLTTVWWHQILAGILMFLGLLMLGLGKRTLNKAPFYIPGVILFFMTFWIKRYAWPFYYLSIFLLKPVANFLKPNNEKHTLLVSSIIAILFFVSSIYIKFPFDEITNYNWSKYCRLSVDCSPEAAEIVIKNKLNNDKLLTIYDYGGWLIWNYPEIKPTIDGRMHLWRDEKGFSAFEYYYPIEQSWKDINETAYQTVLTSHNKPIYGRLLELSNEGKWTTIYNDPNSAVFVRNK